MTTQNVAAVISPKPRTVMFIDSGVTAIIWEENVEPTPSTILDSARKVIQAELKALHALLAAVDDNLEQVVRLIQQAEGQVIVTGLGKSGHIGRKIAATLASTGTPAFFMHTTEGVHGDLGMITADDVVLALSFSGSTAETLNLIGPIHRIGTKLIAITGRGQSPLAQSADVVLDIGVREEADPLGLAPTSSTTAMLALGDALAIALSVDQQFAREDFGKFHPGGSLGRLRSEFQITLIRR